MALRPIDVKQSPNAQDAFWPIPDLMYIYIYSMSQSPNVEEPVTWSHHVCCLLCDQMINQALHIIHHTAPSASPPSC